MSRPKTLYDKIVDSHTVRRLDEAGGEVLLYIDRTVLNEYTSPQAFTGLREAGRQVWRPGAALGTVDHVNPTATRRVAAMADDGAARQTCYFAENCRDFGIELFDVLHRLQGIEHVVMPELGLVLPGMVIAAGDSHTTTYGALGVEGRMTICNMAAEAGARGVVMAPDETVIRYLENRPRAPQGALWKRAAEAWSALAGDEDAVHQRDVTLQAETIEPMVSWGTSPDQAAPIGQAVPDPSAEPDAGRRRDLERALGYMGLIPGTPLAAIPIDRAFIGSCTNARIEDLRAAAAILRGRRVADGVRAMVVPGSSEVRRIAEQEGLDRVFIEAGFEWRQSGCSMCLAMNDDFLAPGERCASSTNRNFEGRQGVGGSDGLAVSFDIEPTRRQALMEGLDAIGTTLRYREEIKAFEQAHLEASPWLA